MVVFAPSQKVHSCRRLVKWVSINGPLRDSQNILGFMRLKSGLSVKLQSRPLDDECTFVVYRKSEPPYIWRKAYEINHRPLDMRSTPGGTRTPNRLVRSQILYPLSYGRLNLRDLPRQREVFYQGRVRRFELPIFWATTRRVNHYTTPAMGLQPECYHK